MIEKIKSVPMAIWIGLALVLIVIFLMNNHKSSSAPPQPQTTPGPVTASTVGTPGAQSNAGTDQQLGNLSQMTQGGFAQILQQEQAMQDEIAQLQSGDRTGLTQTASVPASFTSSFIANGMNGAGTGMTQFGGSMQNAQNVSALNSAFVTANPMPVANFQG
jgi:hypothetical protein